jgi:hypothetical protein
MESLRGGACISARTDAAPTVALCRAAGIDGHLTLRAPHVELVPVLVGDAESQPLAEAARGIDLHHAEGDGLRRMPGFLDDAAADPLPLETPLQIELHVRPSGLAALLRTIIGFGDMVWSSAKSVSNTICA